jgi:hypothetical protein
MVYQFKVLVKLTLSNAIGYSLWERCNSIFFKVSGFKETLWKFSDLFM